MYNQKHHRFDSFYNHKFGFHICGPHAQAFETAVRLKPKVVKTLDFSVDAMKRIREAVPDVFLIGRLFVHPQDFGNLSGGTAAIARQKGREMAERILREEVNRDVHHHQGRPLIPAWESLNEVFPEWTDENTQKIYDEYQVAFGQKMIAEGFDPIAFNFGQGNGRGRQWLRLYPGTLELYTYLGFHEYDWPTMDRLHQLGLNGPVEMENRVPGGEGRGNDGMWRCLRYRRIMNEGIRQTFGDKHTVIITECGMTQGVWGGPSLDIGPWATEVTVPPDIPGGAVSSPIPVEDYWQSLQWYNSELMKDDYVLGACLFVTGASGKPEWETFEHLGPILDRLAAFQQPVSLSATPGSTTPIPDQPPVDTDPPVPVSDGSTSTAPEPGDTDSTATISDTPSEAETGVAAPPTLSQAELIARVDGGLHFRDERNVYRVGEKVFVQMSLTNPTDQNIPFGFMGLLDNTGRFQTSWDNDTVPAGRTFRHVDGLSFDQPGTYRIQLSVCFADADMCRQRDEVWRRFNPGLIVTIRRGS